MNQIPLSKLSRQWQPWLSWFDVELQPMLVELLSALNALLGPIKEEHALSQDFSSGLGMLRQKGLYQHLLLSEWLLAEEMPDEFIRRAAVGEHLFLAPVPDESKSNHRIIALFDVGVLQLGRQRLIHLVMMILLDRRAKKQHSQFCWGTIQQPAQLYEFTDSESLFSLLNQKGVTSATDARIENWSAYLQNHSDFDECWFIGASITKTKMNQTTIFSHSVCVEPSVINHQQLRVMIEQSNKQRVCQLRLPNDVICMKMLSTKATHNNHLAKITKKSLVPIDIHFRPIMSMTGNHFVTLNAEHSNTFLCALSDTLSLKQKCSLYFQHLKDQIFAFDFQGKKLSAIIKNRGAVCFWQPNKPSVTLAIDSEELLFNQQYQQQFIWLYTNRSSQVYLINRNNELFSYLLNNHGNSQIASGIRIDTSVLGIFKLDNKTSLYVTLEESSHLTLKSEQLSHLNYALGQKGDANQQMYIADESRWLKGFGVFAIGSDQRWLVFKANSLTDALVYSKLVITTPVGWQVFGLHHQKSDDTSALVLIHQDRKRVALFHIEHNEIEEIYYSRMNIVQYTFSSLAKSFALTFENGDLILYSLVSQGVRVHLSKG